MTDGYFTRATLLPSGLSGAWHRNALMRGAMHRDHALVWRLFPGDGMPRDFVYRVGVPTSDGAIPYYIVSQRRPVAVPGEVRTDVKVYRPHFSVGDTLSFSLRANPTVSRGVAGARSKRHDVLMDAKKGKSGLAAEEAVTNAASTWLLSRAESLGLTIEPTTLRFDGYRQHRSIRRSGAALRFSSVDFEGLAVVTNPLRLITALFDGVGHSKGFGCGLLLVRRRE